MRLRVLEFLTVLGGDKESAAAVRHLAKQACSVINEVVSAQQREGHSNNIASSVTQFDKDRAKIQTAAIKVSSIANYSQSDSEALLS